MEVAALASCSSKKRDNETVAWNLYSTSTLFRKNWTAASYLGDPYVMSAKHGLVDGGTKLEPYDESIHEMSQDERFYWGRDVVGDLHAEYDAVVILGGRKYVEPIRCAIEDCRPLVEIFDPYVHTSGNGQQMRVADRIVEARVCGAAVDAAIAYGTEPYLEDE